jgi:hypothetical protein
MIFLYDLLRHLRRAVLGIFRGSVFSSSNGLVISRRNSGRLRRVRKVDFNHWTIGAELPVRWLHQKPAGGAINKYDGDECGPPPQVINRLLALQEG